MSEYWYNYDAVVSPECSEDDIRSVLKDRKARKVGDIPSDSTQLREEIWGVPSGDRIRIVWDHFMDVVSLRAESQTPNEPAELVFSLRKQLGLQEIGDLVRLAQKKDSASRSFAVRGLATIASSYYSDIADAIKAALADEDPGMRAVALRCIARWPHFVFVEALERQAKVERDDGLRREEIRLAKDVRKHGRRGIS